MDENVNPKSVLIPLEWKAVVLANGTRFDWHKAEARDARDREQLSGARVYRWALRGPDGSIKDLYIGQSGKFEKRLSSYRSKKLAKGSTEALVRDAMGECERQRGTVDLEFLHIETPFIINGKRIDKHSMGLPEVRIMIEHIAIVTAKAERIHVINQLRANANLVAILKLVKKIVSPGNYPEVSGRIESILDSNSEEGQSAAR